ncbi:hypothetical protein [Rothia halotolerans]|uniref:hypothetical protein n=1 Tax=Rothia halotolerans TaxID=405770 RepID=UPI00101D4623|nr:hypothetical protein [Rothia halotolerans]
MTEVRLIEMGRKAFKTAAAAAALAMGSLAVATPAQAKVTTDYELNSVFVYATTFKECNNTTNSIAKDLRVQNLRVVVDGCAKVFKNPPKDKTWTSTIDYYNR